MAKRFTDTEQWDKEWFMNLPCKLKCLVKFVRDKCDIAGVWSPNWIIANTYIGEAVTEAELLAIDGGRQFKKMDGGKIFCLGFIEFQYGKLSEKSPVHRKIISILKGYNIPYQYPINRVQEEEEDKEKEMEEEKEVEKVKEKEGGVGGFVPPSQAMCEEFFTACGKTAKEGEIFFCKYQQRGWKDGSGNHVTDWSALAKSWILNGKNFYQNGNTKRDQRREPAPHGTGFGNL